MDIKCIYSLLQAPLDLILITLQMVKLKFLLSLVEAAAVAAEEELVV
jgi:hypothetical protein|tara:strand:- start:1734 stop:1874 length:141 start_codon:yes stop_codon:yes gene_type:complete